MKNKRRSFFLPLFLSFLFLVAAVIVFGAIRFFLLRDQDENALVRVLWETLPALIPLLLLGGGWLAYLFFRMVKPVGKMRDTASRIASRVSEKKVAPAVPASGCLAELSETLSREEEKLVGLIKEVAETSDASATEREKLIAAEKLSESVFPARLTFGGLTYSVSAKVLRAADAGADFCDGFPLDKRHAYFAIGDVWGKGLPASLFAAKLLSVLRAEIAGGKSPAEALGAANTVLREGNGEALAATVFCAVFDFDSGECRYANAGHVPPVIAGEALGFLRMRAGTPVGLYPDAVYTDEQFTLRHGQGMFFYTDGVTNAGGDGESFGYDRMFTVLKEYYGNALSAESVAEGVLNAAEEFCKGKRSDDLAALALFFPAGVQRLLRPVKEDLESMQELLDGWLQDDPRKRNIQLACEEIFMNIVDHAGAKAIQISCEKEESSLIIRFTDDGEPFNPLQANEEKRELYSYAEGGMGMTIIRRIAGEIFYRTKQNLNVLTVRFPIIRGI